MIDSASVNALSELMTWISSHEDSWLESIPFIEIQYNFAKGGYWTVNLDGQPALEAGGGWTLLLLVADQFRSEYPSHAGDQLSEKARSLAELVRRNRSAHQNNDSSPQKKCWVLLEEIQRAIDANERNRTLHEGKTAPGAWINNRTMHTQLIFELVCFGETDSNGADLYDLKPNLLTACRPTGLKIQSPQTDIPTFLKHVREHFSPQSIGEDTYHLDNHGRIGGILNRACVSTKSWKLRPRS